ncbi:MAG: hypothetical protein R2684_12915 [Pyrinomonadaceae bacterium]
MIRETLLKHIRSISYRLLPAVLLCVFASGVWAQEIVDKTVATVSDGVHTELITYSDLMWQLALVPSASISPATSEDLNRALQVIIRQRLIALEAERLPTSEPTERQISNEINRILDIFPSSAEFVRRLNLVGFSSVNDENFQRMMRQRVAIENYLEFRFRSFVVITPDDEKKYYDSEFVPDFKKRNPGLEIPELSAVRAQINQILTEQKVENDIETFLDNARTRAEIIILSEV